MKTQEEVKSKFVVLRDKYFKERVRAYLEQKPINCCFSRKAKIGGSKCFVCVSPSLTEITDCNCEKCKGCHEFACRNTEEGVLEDFNKILSSPSRCAQEYPKLAMMLWFLQDVNPRIEKKPYRSFCGLFG